MKYLILKAIQIALICYLNGFLIKLTIEEFKSKNYVFFGAYCTAIFAIFTYVSRVFIFPVG